jgi:hypothetical protein
MASLLVHHNSRRTIDYSGTHPTDAVASDDVHVGRTGRGPRVQDVDLKLTREQIAARV